ncbi:MAG: glycogen synthase, partial [Nitrospinaceae bacterium]|nr:glycogen/starch synthase [Nitrospinaceae bacterium]NIR54971.1 glycogen/starch synthase [Nitrospinaceae bacterium]NIS85384.1 glycogen/starch synthase [Nitrospinaceae bacterium]NIT82211.1 glycogen/starch synthase [Nitrospinaceae bacterium]NIU44455.1 glycogen/starch synthase [Nitrospinaceae bacterium]
MARKLKILFTSSEVYPYAKTGGLADISGALPKALQQLGHDVRVLMPKYKSVVEAPQGFEPLHREVDVPLAGRSLKGFLFQGRLDSEVPIYFMENDGYFYRDQLYGSASRDYPDNAERFIFFCRAILETCRTLGFRPDIIHCNDWQTGLVPVYLKTVYAGDPWFAGTRTI